MHLRLRTLAALAVLASLACACALVFPVLLAIVGHWWRPDWEQLADVGEVYGSASAVFSAVAVVVVAASLMYQAHELRLARVQAVREAQRALWHQAAEDPLTYGPLLGLEVQRGTDAVELKKRLFVQILLQYLRMGHEAGVFTANNLRVDALRSIFSTKIGRSYWRESADLWRTTLTEVGDHKYVAIVDEAYHAALASDPDETKDRSSSGRKIKRSAAVCVATVAAASWIYVVRRRRRRTHGTSLRSSRLD
jgi:hypothetical protein